MCRMVWAGDKVKGSDDQTSFREFEDGQISELGYVVIHFRKSIAIYYMLNYCISKCYMGIRIKDKE